MNINETTGFWSGISVMQLGSMDRSVPQRAPPSAEPLKLPEGFRWDVFDTFDEGAVRDAVQLLNAHYVENVTAGCRMIITDEFFHWTISSQSPVKGCLAIRVACSGKMVGFVSGTPTKARYGQDRFRAAIMNYLCVHGKLRNKRMLPVLIAEITRIGQLHDIDPGIYTSATLIHEPVCVARYYQRVLDRDHMLASGFDEAVMRLIDRRLPTAATGMSMTKWRLATRKDVPVIKSAMETYSERFEFSLDWRAMSDDEVALLLMPRENVLHSFVDDATGAFMSFYVMPVRMMATGAVVSVGHMFYYALLSDSDRRVPIMIEDAMVLAKRAGCHVFNALNVMDTTPGMLLRMGFVPVTIDLERKMATVNVELTPLCLVNRVELVFTKLCKHALFAVASGPRSPCEMKIIVKAHVEKSILHISTRISAERAEAFGHGMWFWKDMVMVVEARNDTWSTPAKWSTQATTYEYLCTTGGTHCHDCVVLRVKAPLQHFLPLLSSHLSFSLDLIGLVRIYIPMRYVFTRTCEASNTPTSFGPPRTDRCWMIEGTDIPALLPRMYVSTQDVPSTSASPPPIVILTTDGMRFYLHMKHDRYERVTHDNVMKFSRIMELNNAIDSDTLSAFIWHYLFPAEERLLEGVTLVHPDMQEKIQRIAEGLGYTLVATPQGPHDAAAIDNLRFMEHVAEMDKFDDNRVAFYIDLVDDDE